MTNFIQIELHNGKLRKTQTLIYNDGMISKRIFAKPDDKVPFDIVWLSKAMPISNKQLVFCCE